MMTRRTIEPKIYYNFSLDEKIPKDHLLRRINEAVDFSFIYSMVKEHYSHTGAPSVDPVVVFKLSLIGYLYDISSERRLLEEASLNLAYLWFLGYEIDEPLPDHSIMTKARTRFGVDTYREFFHAAVKACIDAGLVEGEACFLDSTLIDANSNRFGVRSKALIDELSRSTDKFVDNLFEGQDSDSKEQPCPKLPTKVNERFIHPKDPDADIVSRDDREAKLCYKGHIAVDSGKPRIITAAALTGGAIADQHLLWSLLAEHEELVRRPSYMVADQKYGTTANFRTLKVKGIKSVIAPQSGRGPSVGLSSDNFTYDGAKDVFICPTGNLLKRASSLKGWKPYRSRKADCSKCYIKEACIPGKQRRTIMAGPNNVIFSWAREHLATSVAKRLAKMRKIWPETIFGNAKEFHGLSKAKFRGRWKVEVQLLMTMAAINLKKLVKYGGKSRISGQIAKAKPLLLLLIQSAR